MKKTLVVEKDGTNYVLETDRAGMLKTLQGAVGGLVEPIDFGDNLTMWVNEEGKLNGMEPNWIATAFFMRRFGVNDVIHGDVIFTGGTDKHGNTLGLNKEIKEALQRVVWHLRDLYAMQEEIVLAENGGE